MKTKLLLVTFLLTFSTFTKAIETFDCEMFLPSGEGQLVLEGRDVGDAIELNFLNDALSETLEGSFTITYVAQKWDNFIAQGHFLLGEEEIEATLQGSLNPNKHNQISFSIYAKWDHRIEYGYGNITTCE